MQSDHNTDLPEPDSGSWVGVVAESFLATVSYRCAALCPRSSGAPRKGIGPLSHWIRRRHGGRTRDRTLDLSRV